MINARKALDRMLEGNERFVNGRSIHPNKFQEVRNAQLDKQTPHAIVISCSDSRVPVELVFDTGFGDIFVIRTAGHVISTEVIASVEYAVKYLGVKLIMVLGHYNCGAIGAAMASRTPENFNELSDYLKSLVSHIHPAIGDIEDYDRAIEQNVKYQVQELLTKDEDIAQRAIVIGAVYCLETGKVEVLK